MLAGALGAALLLGLPGCRRGEPPMDEAMAAGLTAADLPQTADRFFDAVDSGIGLSAAETRGRNTWLLWTAGNQAFWDHVSGHSLGAFDLLKLLSSRSVRRGNRFAYLGVVNEPGFEEATAPGEHGLWLDVRRTGTPPEPFDPEVYGRASGIVGLRLFPNPAFDQAAEARWNPERYFGEPSYYLDPGLVRPYRVGMSCAFCHVSPNPIRPPADPESPEWADLSTHTGAQYLRFGRVFGNLLPEASFVWHHFNALPPGTADTSLLATDNVLNPRRMNGLYRIGARLAAATEETLAGGNLDLPGTSVRMAVPHVLKDGADSVGVQGALARVYVSIGAYHQEWLRHFRLLVGGKKQTPFPVAVANERSVYWQATVERLPDLAAFFVKVTGDPLGTHQLEDAPGGAGYLTASEETLRRGALVFAESCAGCHSSKRPPEGVAPRSEEARAWFREAVLRDDWEEGNYLSEDRRHPVTVVGTNACSALATNALRGHVWNDFSSETYKGLPAVGAIRVENPWTGEEEPYDMPGGGRGYVRTPSLVALWSSAPYLHNNTVGVYNGDPSVAGRMAAFEDGIGRMLWPERRGRGACVSGAAAEGGEADRRPFCAPVFATTAESWLTLHETFVPEVLRPFLREELADGELRIGPIPEGTPVALLANLDLERALHTRAGRRGLARLLLNLKRATGRIEAEGLEGEEARAALRELVPGLRALSKCLDYRVDRGHPFGTDLPDRDKRDLIEYLKTL
ncbi:MAG TPA: hypothetical protein VLF66_14370 [Thermoanaerobaculia bacterium]|nr:hypothetical protein [Thermoanaerobaculia bacterium]